MRVEVRAKVRTSLFSSCIFSMIFIQIHELILQYMLSTFEIYDWEKSAT